MTLPRRILRWGLPLLVGMAARGPRAQADNPANTVEPIRFQFDQIYLQTDADLDRETQSAGSPVARVTRQRALVQPVVGLEMSGSVYHPNLLRYEFDPELGLDYEDVRVTPGGAADEARFLQRYHGSLDFLREKPYATSLFAHKDVTYRDYDFFTRVRVESERFGGRTGYLAGAVPIGISAQHYEESQVDLARPMDIFENTVAFNAQNGHRSGHGSTQVSYNLDETLRRDYGFVDQHSLHQSVSLMNSEAFGDREWIRWTSLLNYHSITEAILPSSRFQLQERVQLEHSGRLQSFYEYGFDSATSGPAESYGNQGRIGLSHQLFENLRTGVDVHGNLIHSDSPDSASDTCRYGLGLDEHYTRTVGNWGRITLGYAGGLDHEDRDNNGSSLQVIDEVHVLRDDAVNLLSQPLIVLSTIVLTDSTGTVIYQPGLDYELIRHGTMTEVRRIPGGRIPKGSPVLVDYTALLQPSAAFSSLSNNATFRFDFWNGLVGIYGRWSTQDYAGGESLLLRWINDKTVGVDSTWRWLRTGAEYQTVDSNLAPYRRVRLMESVQFQPADGTALGVDVDQNWTHFPETHENQTVYGFIARVQQRFTAHLSWDVEGGVRMERGTTFDRDLGTARTELNWAVAKLHVKVGYGYNSESYGADGRERHHAYVRLRRTFR